MKSFTSETATRFDFTGQVALSPGRYQEKTGYILTLFIRLFGKDTAHATDVPPAKARAKPEKIL